MHPNIHHPQIIDSGTALENTHKKWPEIGQIAYKQMWFTLKNKLSHFLGRLESHMHIELAWAGQDSQDSICLVREN